MKTIAKLTAIAGTMVLSMVALSPAQAQASRTWVSGVGDDVNPCSRTAPCKTFAGAMSKTAVGGEIDALDPAGFGSVTIPKSMTIDGGGGIVASVLNSLTPGVTVNPGSGGVVVLRNLSINGVGSGTIGVRALSGNALHLEHMVISGQTGLGVDFEPSAASGSPQLVMNDVIVRNTAGGVLVKPGGGLAARATLKNVELDQNSFGLTVNDNSNVVVTNSLITGNSGDGVIASSAGVDAFIGLESTIVSSNGGNGLNSTGVSTIRISNVDIFSNNNSVAPGSVNVLSFQNNHITRNTTNGAPTGTLAPQ